nr:zinc ribbon domain-containing protein [Thetidibacter halocola]
MFRCGLCAGPMIPERQKGRVYYRCHTSSCATKTIREDGLEAAIQSTLSSLEITEEQAGALEQAWVHDTCVEDQARRRDALRLNLAAETGRLDRLTNLAIDGTIDPDTFARKKRDLTLSIAALEEDLAGLPDPAAIKADRMAFLELAKSLAWLHIHGTAAEKREIVENAFSNRTVVGRNVDFEPYQWLQPDRLTQGVLSGALCRDTYRTGIAEHCHAPLSKLLNIKRKRCNDKNSPMRA